MAIAAMPPTTPPTMAPVLLWWIGVADEVAGEVAVAVALLVEVEVVAVALTGIARPWAIRNPFPQQVD